MTKLSITTLLGATLFCGVLSAETVSVNGSTTVLPIMQQVSESFMKIHPEVTLTISGTGSGTGIKALCDKMTDIAMSSRDMKDKEASLAQKNGVMPHRITIGIDAIVPVVNAKNVVQGLTKEQLRAVYMGQIKNWKELGGADAPIVVIARDSSSGTFESWEELVMAKARVTPRALLQSSNGGVVQAVASNTNALGYIGIGYLSSEVKGLRVNGVAPTIDNAKSKAWPILRELYLFTNDTPLNSIKMLIDYTLSEDGQKLVQRSGYVPLTK